MNKDRYKKMYYNRCGKSGLKLPSISLGLWHNFGSNSSFDNMKEMVQVAFDNGITHFDLANNYGPTQGEAEINFGRILKTTLYGYRDELVISTKAGYTMWDGPYGDWGSRKHLLSSLDQSLERMGLEYVDIFYHHRMDTETPLEETMGALAHAVRTGKALYAGISNYDSATTRKAIEIMSELNCPLIVNQVRYSILDRTIEEDGMLHVAKYDGLGITVFSPLEQGILTDRYLKGIPADSRASKPGPFLTEEKITPDVVKKAKKLNEIAQARKQTLAQMALSWVLKSSNVTSVIIGASSTEQILENIEAIKNTTFTREELDLIDAISIAPPSKAAAEK